MLRRGGLCVFRLRGNCAGPQLSRHLFPIKQASLISDDICVLDALKGSNICQDVAARSSAHDKRGTSSRTTQVALVIFLTRLGPFPTTITTLGNNSKLLRSFLIGCGQDSEL
ncbi:hypothetical protein RRG08_052713 [Elysia crispata]|uniref:Uncharacterized protein n=1 Tax=Elysia crispata TaxID=231223 RepID=A0AAE1E9N8_9GAST|nr:hypothetical protein RRG08_052713 [Elysia crispata]